MAWFKSKEEKRKEAWKKAQRDKENIAEAQRQVNQRKAADEVAAARARREQRRRNQGK